MNSVQRFELLKKSPTNELLERFKRCGKGMFKIFEVLCIKGNGNVARPAMKEFIQEAEKRLS